MVFFGQRQQKRLLDVGVACLMLIIFAPVMAVIAVAIKLDSPGPVLFKQWRRGHKGTPFLMLKFRSMYAGSGESQHQDAVERWFEGEPAPGTATYKLVDDPRVTPVGKVIRHLNLDELPQLVNVLRDEMSIVGPRPATEYEFCRYAPHHAARFDALPGITGLWQVSGGHRLSFEEMVELDLRYVTSWSLLEDLGIMLRTIPLIICARGR